MVLIYPATPAYSSERSLAEGKRKDLCGEERVKEVCVWVCVCVLRPPPALQNPTSAACPVLADLKAVSAETEGAVSRHDTAVAAPELMAG